MYSCAKISPAHEGPRLRACSQMQPMAVPLTPTRPHIVLQPHQQRRERVPRAGCQWATASCVDHYQAWAHPVTGQHSAVQTTHHRAAAAASRPGHAPYTRSGGRQPTVRPISVSLPQEGERERAPVLHDRGGTGERGAKYDGSSRVPRPTIRREVFYRYGTHPAAVLLPSSPPSGAPAVRPGGAYHRQWRGRRQANGWVSPFIYALLCWVGFLSCGTVRWRGGGRSPGNELEQRSES
jgi:hypothetical protein